MEVTGQRIDRYVVERQLGAGGFGAVYLARHSVLGTKVALKVLSAQHSATPGMVERFLREAQTAAGIGSPHIVAVSDAGVSADGLPFLAMEVLEGEDLEERIRRAGPLSIPEALDVVIQALDGLGAAHAAGIVHRDMKPANVFLVRGPDGRPFAKLLDFGISKVVDPSKVSSLTKTGMMLGTPAYMAPEQLQDTRGVDHRADLYATAAILFETITGRLPYAADSFGDLMERVQGRAPTRLDAYVPQAPPAIVEVLARGMARDPDERFASATEMARALRAIRQSTFANVPVTTASPQTVTPPLGQLEAPAVLATRGEAGSAAPGAPSGPASDAGWAAPPRDPPGTPPPSPAYGSQDASWSPGDVAPRGSAPASFGAAGAQSWGAGPGPHGPPSSGHAVLAPPKRGAGLWIGVGAAALLLPLACIGGGLLAFNLSEDDPPPAPADPPVAPAPVAPSVPPPTVPRPPSPPSLPSPPPPVAPAVDGPPTAAPIPEGAAACAVPVVLGVDCGRASEQRVAEPCELRRGRELYVLGVYEPSGGGVATVDVARTAAPLVLVLSSYADTTWRLRVADGAEIDAIHVVGRGSSEVEDAPPGARVRRHRRGFPIMGWSWEGMTSAWSGSRTVESAEDETGLSLRAYAGCYDGTRFSIGQRAP